MRKFLVWFVLLIMFVRADGNLNVFTGDKTLDIYIDGQLAGQEQVLQYPLQAGVHYLQIKKNNETVRSRTVEIIDGRTETVVLDDFVDYKTNTASRGAIDMEAMRVRETRGNVGIGVYGGSPASGLSLKWWPWEKFGIQAIGYVNNFAGNRDTRLGGRLLYALNESVYKSSTFTTFLALGGGRSTLYNSIDMGKNEIYDLIEASVGIEFKVADFFSDEKIDRHWVISDSDDAGMVFLTEFLLGVGEGLLKFGHVDMEIGFESMTTHFVEDDDYRDRQALKFSGGYHIYF